MGYLHCRISSIHPREEWESHRGVCEVPALGYLDVLHITVACDRSAALDQVWRRTSNVVQLWKHNDDAEMMECIIKETCLMARKQARKGPRQH